MGGIDQEVTGQQQIHVQNNVMMDISLSVNNEKMGTQTQEMDVTTE